MKKCMKAVGLLCAAMMSATALTGCSLLEGLLGNGLVSSSGNESSVPEKQTEAVTYIGLDINPAIELTVDGENKIVSAYGSNNDGKVLLYGETEFEGMDLEAAIEKIVTLAVELGYLDENNQVVGTDVVGENAEALLASVNSKVTVTAETLGMTVTTDGEGAYSLLRRLTKLQEEYPENEAIQNISVSDFKLALTAAEMGEVTLEVAVEMETDELVDLVANAHTQMETFATDAYELVRLQTGSVYDKALGMAKAAVHVEYCLSNLKLLELAYAAPYFMYEASACGFEASADALACAERLYDYELSETQVAAVLSALKMEDTAANRARLQNVEDKITLNSIEEYADKLFKNTPASEELDEIKVELDKLFDEAEESIDQAIAEAKAKYAPEIEAVIAKAETGLNYLKQVPDWAWKLLPSSISQAIKDFDNVAATVRATLAENDFSEGTFRQLAREMKTKSEEILKQLEGKLSEVDKQAIAEKMAEVEAEYAEEKASLEEKLAEAEREAKERLEEQKNLRLSSSNDSGDSGSNE